VAKGILEAVEQADVVIVNIKNYDSTMQLLRRPEIEPALRGKILVQLSSGTPDEARQMQSWARPLGIEYLDGAIMSYPVGIGKPEGTVLYSGSEELFKCVKPVLLAFGPGRSSAGAKRIWWTTALLIPNSCSSKRRSRPARAEPMRPVPMTATF